MEKLLAELLKAQDNLQDVEFTINDKHFKYYFNYMTLLQKSRIEQMAVKRIVSVNDDGTQEVSYKKQENMIPIHTIIEKALDEKGDRIYSHTNPDHVKEVGLLPVEVASQIAYMMTIDIFGSMKPEEEDK